uniref:Ankyrin repeat protein n=1 Tax=Ditylum brightwellii TaxID=49249 RepID=A0A7S4S4Q3_9STRA
MSVFKKQKMTRSIFELLNVDSKDDVDEGAVIEAAQQNPNDIDRMFEFSWYRCCPLHKALELELGDDVIKLLISPFAIRHKDNRLRTPLRIICEKGASLESLSMVLKAYPEAARKKDRLGCAPLHNICVNESASLEMLSMILNTWPEAAREKDRDSKTPLHRICGNERASLKM